jgi:hypothetical protein
MAKTLQFRRDTTANLASVTGAEGEIFIDLTKDTVVVMDGSTAGGFPLATESYVGTAISNLIDSAPGTLDTLNELAAALGDDANFSTSISNTVATAGGYANSAFSTANTASVNATSSGSYANSAFARANTADQRAVTSGSYANGAFSKANTGTILAQAAFNTANNFVFTDTIYLGTNAGGARASGGIAIGPQSGLTQDWNAIAVGIAAGRDNQKEGGVAVGGFANMINPGVGAVAIGYYAGYSLALANTVAIGSFSGSSGMVNNSISISASGSWGKLATDPILNSGLYIDPVRTEAPTSSSMIVYQNPTTKELTTSTSIQAGSGYIGQVYFSNNIITPANTGVYSTTSQPLVINGDMLVLGSSSSLNYSTLSVNGTQIKAGKKYITANANTAYVPSAVTSSVGDSFEVIALVDSTLNLMDANFSNTIQKGDGTSTVQSALTLSTGTYGTQYTFVFDGTKWIQIKNLVNA